MTDKFSKLPKDAIVYIALTLGLPEILSLCLTSKKFNTTVCKNKDVWITRLRQDFHINYLDIGKDDPKI